MPWKPKRKEQMSSKWLQTILMTTGPSLWLIVEENIVTVTAILEQKSKPHAARAPEVSEASSCEFQRVLLSQTSQTITSAQASCTYHLKQVCDPHKMHLHCLTQKLSNRLLLGMFN